MNTDDQIQAHDGPGIFTRSATPIPMPNGETAPQADGQMVTVANIDQITKGGGDGQKVSSHLTLSGQRSLKEQVQERVARIQADVSTFKDAQLRLADDLFWLLDPAFDRFKEIYKTRRACIAACTGKSRQWGYELAGLGKSRRLALNNGASEERLPDSIPSSKKWLSTHNEDGSPKPQSQSPVKPPRKALNGDHDGIYGLGEDYDRLLGERLHGGRNGTLDPDRPLDIDDVLSDIRALFGDELSDATRIQLRDRLISCIDEICPAKSLPVKLKGKRKSKLSGDHCLSYGDKIIPTKDEDTVLIS
jgi:hypothetical protein